MNAAVDTRRFSDVPTMDLQLTDKLASFRARPKASDCHRTGLAREGAKVILNGRTKNLNTALAKIRQRRRRPI